MTELHAESEEIMSHYRQPAAEYGRITDAPSIPRFSRYTLDELAVLIGDDESLLVEAITRIGNFSDTNDISDIRKAVSKLLRADGIRLKHGKRTNPGLLKMITCLATVLLYFGFPLASSERLRLVRALRMIVEEIGVTEVTEAIRVMKCDDCTKLSGQMRRSPEKWCLKPLPVAFHPC